MPHPITVYSLVLPLPHNNTDRAREQGVQLGEKNVISPSGYKESKMLGLPSMRARGQLEPYLEEQRAKCVVIIFCWCIDHP
jgi:hypothetical protein